jgi:hypothetical protein
MATAPPNPESIEDVFNRRVDAILAARGMDLRDLLEELEKAGYTPDSPATVLLNDAFAIAAVLGVSPVHLLVPDEEEPISLTPEIAAARRDLDLWIRGLKPLRLQDEVLFHLEASNDDLDAELVAETWVRSDSVRVAALAWCINDAVEAHDIERAGVLADLAGRVLDSKTLDAANARIKRPVSSGELLDAVNRAVRLRRQRAGPRTVPRR